MLPKIKPNPNDPTWTYPHASRERIEFLRAYFAKFVGGGPASWTDKRFSPKLITVRRAHEPYVPWQTVPPEFRQAAQEFFDRKQQEWLDQGKQLTRGKIRSLYCNACCYAKNCVWGSQGVPPRVRLRQQYLLFKRDWYAYMRWETEQERIRFEASQEPIARHRVLETA